jgi:hypothetical protein
MYGRKSRIGAHGSDGDELWHAKAPRLVQELRPHHKIVVEELRRTRLVRADAADNGRQMNHDRRPRVRVQPNDVVQLSQVALGTWRRRDRGAAQSAQPFHDPPTKKACAAGHEYSLIAPESHARLPSSCLHILSSFFRTSRLQPAALD